jgi:hypothetical protein
MTDRLDSFHGSRDLARHLARRALLAACMACVALVTLACTPRKVVVVSPQLDAALTQEPIDLDLFVAPTLDAGTLEVTLNGVDVTDLLEHVPGTARWTGSQLWGANLPQLGSNELVVTGSFEGRAQQQTRHFTTEGDAFADCVDDLSLGTNGGFGSQAQVLGAPQGAGAFQGTTDVLSLGLGGWIVLEFRDNTIVDGPGVDFTVFENAFMAYDEYFETLAPFMEPARVSVSQDGSTWYEFDCALDPLEEANLYPGCAGIYPVFADGLDPAAPHASIPSDTPIEDLIGQDIFAFPIPAGSGGDSFDLADVGLEWAAFVRVEAASFLSGPSGGSNNAGFDLDAVAAVHSEPSGLDPACP